MSTTKKSTKELITEFKTKLKEAEQCLTQIEAQDKSDREYGDFNFLLLNAIIQDLSNKLLSVRYTNDLELLVSGFPSWNNDTESLALNYILTTSP